MAAGVSEQEDPARRIDRHRRQVQQEFLAGAQRSKRTGLWLLGAALLGLAWTVWRLVSAGSVICGTGAYAGEECVRWAPWAELLLVLAVSVPLAVAGAALYTRGAVSIQLSHHALSMAGYLDRAGRAGPAGEAARKDAPPEDGAASGGTPRTRRRD